MKKLALLVYPEFSLQEVMNLSRLFRWDYDVLTQVISSGAEPVRSEEGIWVKPEGPVAEFRREDYLCLILPGCSDLTQALRDGAIRDFLRGLSDGALPIGAICSGPLLLAQAGLLAGKKYTASVFMNVFQFCPFLEKENFVAAPSVTAGNILTAGGSNFNGFAVEMARLCGLDCPDRILSGYMDGWSREDYEQYLPPEAEEEARAMFTGL